MASTISVRLLISWRNVGATGVAGVVTLLRSADSRGGNGMKVALISEHGTARGSRAWRVNQATIASQAGGRMAWRKSARPASEATRNNNQNIEAFNAHLHARALSVGAITREERLNGVASAREAALIRQRGDGMRLGGSENHAGSGAYSLGVTEARPDTIYRIGIGSNQANRQMVGGGPA